MQGIFDLITNATNAIAVLFAFDTAVLITILIIVFAIASKK